MTESMLLEIEEIKKLKARYFRFMDKKLWDEWKTVFTEDATLQFGPNPEDIFIGRDQIVARNSQILANATTVHHGHMPEIELTSDTTATGIWAMFDFVQMHGVLTLQGYGHYEEEYRKVDGQWKIGKLRLTRLREDITPETSESED